MTEEIGARTQLYSDPQLFLATWGEALARYEAENNLILGIAGELNLSGLHPKDVLLGVERNGDTGSSLLLEAAFLHTPPQPLHLSYPISHAGVQEIIQILKLKGAAPSGVTAHASSSQVFSSLWAEAAGVRANRVMVLPCYSVSRVALVPDVAPLLRKATLQDFETIYAWARDFEREAKVVRAQDDNHHREKLKKQVEAGCFYVLQEGELLSMLRVSGNTPNGVRISFVYTPPLLRERGFATALVANVSHQMISAGKRFCFLFADSENQTSNGIYQRIGFEKVCDFHEYEFGKERAEALSVGLERN